jgi:hypothetical protein
MWKECSDDAGKSYFWNREDNTVSWAPPAGWETHVFSEDEEDSEEEEDGILIEPGASVVEQEEEAGMANGEGESGVEREEIVVAGMEDGEEEAGGAMESMEDCEDGEIEEEMVESKSGGNEQFRYTGGDEHEQVVDDDMEVDETKTLAAGEAKAKQEEEEQTAMIIRAMFGGIEARTTSLKTKANLAERAVSPLDRFKVELELRMEDWRTGGATSDWTLGKLQVLAGKLDGVVREEKVLADAQVVEYAQAYAAQEQQWAAMVAQSAATEAQAHPAPEAFVPFVNEYASYPPGAGDRLVAADSSFALAPAATSEDVINQSPAVTEEPSPSSVPAPVSATADSNDLVPSVSKAATHGVHPSRLALFEAAAAEAEALEEAPPPPGMAERKQAREVGPGTASAGFVPALPDSDDDDDAHVTVHRRPTKRKLPSADQVDENSLAGKKKKKKKSATFGKQMGGMIDKWNKVRDDQDKVQKKILRDNSAVGLKEKEEEKLATWRRNMISSGEASSNANFIEVSSDWRKRVKQKKRDGGEDMEL